MAIPAPVIEAEMADWVKLGGENWGIVGDRDHRSGFHRAANEIPPTDYSRRRDPNGSDGPYTNWDYACAGDFAHKGIPRLRSKHAEVLKRLLNGELPMICEFIGQPSPDGPVIYWARWNGMKTLKKYTGAGHDTWSHISWYRSAVDRRAYLWVPRRPPSTPPPAQGWTKEILMDLPTLRRGARGEAVERSMGLLAAAGFPPAGSFRANHIPDGIAGEGWEVAVKRFQRAKKIKDDGIVGPVTWRKLLLG